MQTSQQVVTEILKKNGNPERVGLTESPWADTIAAWVREGYPTRTAFKKKGQDRWRREDGMAEEVLEDGEYEEPVPAWEHFGFDMVGTGGWFDVMP